MYAVINELQEEGKEIYILDKDGEDIRGIENFENAVFLLGDYEGLPKKELKRLKKECRLVSLGKKTYFASQCITIVNNELDRKI